MYVCQFFDSDAEIEIDGRMVLLRQRIDRQTGSFHLSSDSAGKQRIGEVTSRVLHNPECLRVTFQVESDGPVPLHLHVRRPAWAGQGATCFVSLEKEAWQLGDVWQIDLPRSVRCEKMAGDESRFAFLYGPVVLAGLTDAETALHVDPAHPEAALARANEREWGNWTEEFLTTTEDRAIRFIPLYDVGYERYAVYFRAAGAGNR